MLRVRNFARLVVVILSGAAMLAVPVLAQGQQQQPAAQQAPPVKSPRFMSPNGEEYWIDPDRPHIADSSVNVPKGLYLQEIGFQQTYHNPSGTVFDIPETILRLGVASRTELRFNVPNWVHSTVVQNAEESVPLEVRHQVGPGNVEGFGDIQVGFKHRLTPIPGKFQMAVNPYLSVPTGAQSQTSHKVDYFVKLPFSRELNGRWDIEGMESLFFPHVNGQIDMDWQTCLVLNRSWGRNTNVFVEYVGDVFEHGPMSNIIHFGGAYRPNRRNQLDCQFGFGLNSAAPRAFFGFGYSFLLGKLELF